MNKWKDGVGKAINFSYFSPYDVVIQPVEAFMKTLQEGKMNDEKRREIFFQMINPFGEGPVGKTIQPFISEAIALEKWNDVAPAGFFTGGRGGETKTGANKVTFSPMSFYGAAKFIVPISRDGRTHLRKLLRK